MVRHQPADLVTDRIAEAKPFANLARHLTAKFTMTMEANATILSALGASWLGNIMKQHRQPQGVIMSFLEARQTEACVRKDISLRMVLGRLFHTVHGLYLGENLFKQPGFRQQDHCPGSLSIGENLAQLISDSLPGDIENFWRTRFHRRQSGRLDGRP